MAEFFQKLKERIFGKSHKTGAVPREQAAAGSPARLVANQVPAEPKRPSLPPPPQRDPYFVQIGFDFGTAFSKCVCRDMYIDKAWVHIPISHAGTEYPFLIASAVCFDGENFRHSESTTGAYQKGGLHHVKMALVKVVLEEWDDPLLRTYRATAPDPSNTGLARFVESCAIYLIGGALGRVRQEVRERFGGRIDGDYLAVNMAVPVADADHPKVMELYECVLRTAWVLSDELAGYPPTPSHQMTELIERSSAEAEQAEVRESCFIYPEVSANVQAFVRSRSSSEGIYLFSDTGAGTVDQSVFLYARPDGKDLLTYLHASVLPLGSSHLERLAAAEAGAESWDALERWRQLKESGNSANELQVARSAIHEPLGSGTFKTLCLAKQKLRSKRQLSELRIIFGGGGHCERPYRDAVIKQFDGGLFRAKAIQTRKAAGDSFHIGMPIPKDLELDTHQRRWMARLTVAYGLSFERGQLADFTLPKDVPIPTEVEIWKPVYQGAHAPTKDEV